MNRKLIRFALIVLVLAMVAGAVALAVGPQVQSVIIRPTPPCSLCDNYTTPIPRWDCIHCDIR